MTKYLRKKSLVFAFFLLIILTILGGSFFFNKIWPVSKTEPASMVMDPWRLCDLDHSGDCDSNDQQIFDKAFGKCRGDTGYNFEADIDGDGCVVSADRDSFTGLFQEIKANWQTYNNSVISFKYPLGWISGKVQVFGSSNEIIFEDPRERFKLSYNERINYSPETGKPYSSFIEYIKIPYLEPIRQIDGYEIYQVLPRAGSEQSYTVYFFSKSGGPILALELDTLTRNEKDIKDGQELFSYILNSFKFLDK